MRIIKIEENADGGATLEMEIGEEEKRLLIEWSINRILRDYIEDKEKGIGTS